MEHQAKRNKKQKQNNGMRLGNIQPITATQSKLFNNYDNYDVISLHGHPGVGKSFLALYKALEDVEFGNIYNKVIIVRSNVSVREIGFLPGNSKEKMAEFEAPYKAIVSELYHRDDAYEILKQKGTIVFAPTSYMRGITFSDCIVIIDECQNMSFQELHTLLTRVGSNCKLILCGDIYQDDLTSERYKEKSGYRDVIAILSRIKMCYNLEFVVDDIVRSGFVKEYILAKIAYERRGKIEKVQPTFLTEIAESIENAS